MQKQASEQRKSFVLSAFDQRGGDGAVHSPTWIDSEQRSVAPPAANVHN